MRRAGEAFTPNDCRLDARRRGRARGSPSSPAPTWPASRPSCARTRCWPSWPRPARFVPAKRFRLGRGRPPVQPRRRRRRPGARPLDLHGRDGRDRGHPHPGDAALVRDPGRDRPRHRHLRRPRHRLGLRRGAARRQPLPRPLRHPLSRAGRRWRSAWRTSPTCRCGPRSGTASWSSCTRPGPGRADRSYGVQVAKLAGVPPAVVARARQVLDRLESEAVAPRRPRRAAAVRRRRAGRAGRSPAPAPVEAALAALDLDGMSPREAMDALYRLKGLAGR